MLMRKENYTRNRLSFAQKILFKLLAEIKHGNITIIDKFDQYFFSGIDSVQTHAVTITINDSNVYKTILLEGSIGAGKCFVEGKWEVDNLSKLLEIFILNTTLFNHIESPISKLINFLKNKLYKSSNNNIIRSKQNILAHYDLGNDFFQLFLDPTMMYSCALYEPEHISLEEASIKKLSTICNTLQLQPHDHILEIGTGWGGFACYAAQHYGCKVTTTTISDKQYVYVKREIERLKLQNQIELLNLDYRKLTGKYDKVVSIEMIEAVGYKNFDRFFHQCNNLLRPGGLLFLQAIIINDQYYDYYKSDIDFIRKYIFPGGCLPSINSISLSITNKTNLQLIHLRDIGKHYVKTLNAWYHNLLENINTIKQLGFSDEFIRMWQFYFCSSAAAFNTHHTSNIHALWRKHK